MAGLTMSCGRRWLTAPYPVGALTAGLTEVSPFRINHPSVGARWLAPASPVGAGGWPHGGSHPQILSPLWAPDGWPQILLWAPLAGRTEVPIPINPSFRLLRPRPTPPPPLFSFCPRHPTHSEDYNSNILCRIPGHRLALIPSLIIPTTDYVLRLEHEKLRCGDGIHKHT